MPIYPIPPEIQALVSGQPGVGIQPTFGHMFDALVGSAKQESTREQEAQRTMFDTLSRQTPGFSEYVIANHPDLIQSMTAPPRLFRRKGEPEFGARLSAAMQGFRSQPPPAEMPVTGAESANITEHVLGVLSKHPNWRKLSPEAQNQAFALAEHMSRSPSPDDRAQAFQHLQMILGPEPSEEQQKYAAAIDTLGDPALGYSNQEKAATAAGYALGKNIDPTDKRQFDAQIRLKDAKLKDLEIAGRLLDNADKVNIAARGKAIPSPMLQQHADLLYVGRRVQRAYDLIDGLGFGETNLGNLLHAPAYSEQSAEYAALLNDLGEDYLRFSKRLPGRVSAQLIDLLRNALVTYDKTPTQLRGVIRTTVSNLLDQYEASLDALRAAGVGSDAYYAAEEKNLQPLLDLETRIREQVRTHPSKTRPTIRERLFGPAALGPGAAPATPEDVLFNQQQETP